MSNVICYATMSVDGFAGPSGAMDGIVAEAARNPAANTFVLTRQAPADEQDATNACLSRGLCHALATARPLANLYLRVPSAA